ncbi:transposase [Caldibacillus debilis]
MCPDIQELGYGARFVFGCTNGFLEGINNHTKLIKRNAVWIQEL